VKIKYKLSLMMAAIVVVVAAGIAVLLLRKASGISIDLCRRGVDYLALQQAEFWKGREEGYIRALRTLSYVMDEYETIPPDQRRDRYDDMLRSALGSEPNMVSIYTVWKPNALDGLDSRYRGRTGSGPSGQYAMRFSKETGRMEGSVSVDIEKTMAHLNGPNAEKDRVDQPVPWRVNGKDTYVVRMMVPVSNPGTGEVVAGIGCLVTIDVIQTTVEKTLRSHDEIAAMAVYSSNGFIMGSFRPERVGKMMGDVDLQYGKNLTEAARAVREGKVYSNYNWAPLFKQNMQYSVVPITVGTSDTTWSVMIGAIDDYMLTEVKSITRFTVILALIAIVFAVVIVYFVLNGVTGPIVRVADTLKDISEGEGDLTRNISVQSKDEIGSLALYFNKTLEKIRNLVVSIRGEAARLSAVGDDLSSNMTETAASMNEIAANIQSIKGRVINQSAGVVETNRTMEQVVSNIYRLNGHVESQSGSVTQASAALEEMVANINSVTEALVKNSGNVRTLKEASEVGRTGLRNVAADIQEIARESEGLLQINAVMKNIASQTNLLSMNAAIEAAHAGDAGKGFAVVADEIRKLAENSGEQSKTISAVLKKIKGSIDKITMSTDNVLDKFEAIDSGVKVVAEQEDVIRAAMEEQGEGSKQILKSAGKLNDITGEVKSGSDEMLEGSKEVIRESQNLEKVTQEITLGMNEMATGADQINVAIHNVNEISNKNREGIDTLMREVSRFKVE